MPIPFTTLLRVGTDGPIPQNHVFGVVGGKQMPFPEDKFALPPSMDGRPFICVNPSTSLFPSDEAGGTDIRQLLHSKEPNCAMVQAEFAGFLSLVSLVATKEIAVGETLTVDHDIDFQLCCCGKCTKSLCEHCHRLAVLEPCLFCRMSYYCSMECRTASAGQHTGPCGIRRREIVTVEKKVLHQLL